MKEADDTKVILQDTEAPRLRRRPAKRQSFFMVSSVVPVIIQIYIYQVIKIFNVKYKKKIQQS